MVAPMAARPLAAIVAVIRPIGRSGYKVARASTMPGLPVSSPSNVASYFKRWPRAHSLFIAGWHASAPKKAHAAPGALRGLTWKTLGPLASPMLPTPPHARGLYTGSAGTGDSHVPLPAPENGPPGVPSIDASGGAASPAQPVKTTVRQLFNKYEASKPISVVTAYDYPSAQLAERAGVDVVLVGDSLGMVVLGYDSTTPVTMCEMVHHAKAARRGAPHAFMVVDLPFGSYLGEGDALRNSTRLLKEAGADAVKLEGGRRVLPQVRALADAGIAVMGHVGLTPQTHAVLGGYRVQGKTAHAARELLEDALALQHAGCFAVVLECVPAEVAALVTQRLEVPTIGIGAGVGTSGQVQVMHDLLGLYDRFQPKFSRRYAALGAIAERALLQYVAEVDAGQFPAPEHSFSMPAREWRALTQADAADVVDEMPAEDGPDAPDAIDASTAA